MAKRSPERILTDFYQKNTRALARDLLGQRLVCMQGGRRISGIITETEAYLGLEDPACHSFGGRRSERVESMYLPAGHAYVYLIYGIHHCFNVVSGTTEEPEAVLIRALQPDEGIPTMLQRRRSSEATLTTGPGRLCEALGIDKSHDRVSLMESKIFLEKAWTVKDNQSAKRATHWN